MAVPGERRLGLMGGGVDRRSQVVRRAPRLIEAGSASNPDVSQPKVRRAVLAGHEVEAQPVFGNGWIEVGGGRVDNRAEVDRRGPVGEAGRSVVAFVISTITVAVRFSSGRARRHPDVVAATARSIGREHERSTVERQTWLELGCRRVDGSPHILGHGPGLQRASTP